jgi:hypothetical protein
VISPWTIVAGVTHSVPLIIQAIWKVVAYLSVKKLAREIDKTADDTVGVIAICEIN